MGACNIEFEMEGTPIFGDIQKRFKEQQEIDSQENGSQSGYSGDFQTVDTVENHTHLIFNSYDEAHNYCLEKSKKWESVVAVRYRFVDKIKPTLKIEKLQNKISELIKELSHIQNTKFTMPEFKSCSACKSRIATKHMRGSKCPVCGDSDLRPASAQKAELKLRTKIAALVKKRDEQAKKELDKALKKYGKVGTLVAGWGAC